MARLDLSGVCTSFEKHEVINNANLVVEDGGFCVFVGPSGCGKAVNDVDPSDRCIAMVFQSYAPYPHMSVRDNMGFGLRMAGTPRAEIAARVERAAEILQITTLLNRRPAQLSGGQRPRVAIGRAIVREPDVSL